MQFRLLATFLLVSSVCLANAQTAKQTNAELDRIIARNKQMEDLLTQLYQALDKGTVVMLTVNEGRSVPVRTADVRDGYVREFLLAEAQRNSPNYAKAEEQAIAAANHFLSKRREESRQKMRDLVNQMSVFRTQRQKAERQKAKVQQGINIGFSGTWDSNWGKMELTQSGSHVSGTYTHAQGKIDGNIQPDGRLHFNWTQNNAKGIGVFKLAADGRTLSGTWNYTNDSGAVGAGGGWTATRK